MGSSDELLLQWWVSYTIPAGQKEAGGVDDSGCISENGLVKKVCYQWGIFVISHGKA